MDGSDGIELQGSAPYYLNRGLGRPEGSGPGPNVHGGSATVQTSGVHSSVFKPRQNPNIRAQQCAGVTGGGAVSGSTFHVDNPSPSFPHGMSMAVVPSGYQGGETVKKKRGRPRKYGPDRANMSHIYATRLSSGQIVPGEKAHSRRGRPPGTGWKQKLAPLGEWMNNSAGLAFTPHVLHVGVGEDVTAKVLAFAQQRPRALCILSGNGTVSRVTLRQPTTSGGTVTYEGRFEILCLSGSYLLADDGGPRDRTGGISISVCSPDGHIIGGAIGGRLIAANPVQVVACSFVCGNTNKGKGKSESGTKDEKFLLYQSAEKSTTPVSATPIQIVTPNSGTSGWQSGSRPDVKYSDIDLMRG